MASRVRFKGIDDLEMRTNGTFHEVDMIRDLCVDEPDRVDIQRRDGRYQVEARTYDGTELQFTCTSVR